MTRSPAYGPSSARSGPISSAGAVPLGELGSNRPVPSTRRLQRIPQNTTLSGATFFRIPTYSSRARESAELDKKIDQGLASESRHSHSVHPSDHTPISPYTNLPATPCVSTNIPLTFSWHGPISAHHSQRPKRTRS